MHVPRELFFMAHESEGERRGTRKHKATGVVPCRSLRPLVESASVVLDGK